MSGVWERVTEVMLRPSYRRLEVGDRIRRDALAAQSRRQCCGARVCTVPDQHTTDRGPRETVRAHQPRGHGPSTDH